MISPREAARAALPEGAFLRRDRGEALFVTDAPRLCPSGDWRGALEAADFLVAADGGLARLTPGPRWLAELEARFPEPPDPFCATLLRFAGQPPEPESLALFTAGLKALEAGGGADYEKRLRQRAAVCLRLNRTANTTTPHPPVGGGLYACALLTHLMKEAST